MSVTNDLFKLLFFDLAVEGPASPTLSPRYVFQLTDNK